MLYAVIAKSQRPELTFRNLKVLHIPSEEAQNFDSIHNDVDVDATLEVIENFLQEEKPDVYKKLLEKSPKIFVRSEYNDVNPDILRPDADPAMELKLKLLELQSIILYDKNIVEKVVRGKKSSSDRHKRILQLTEEINELKGDKSISYAS